MDNKRRVTGGYSGKGPGMNEASVTVAQRLTWFHAALILAPSDWGLFPVGDWPWGFPGPFVFHGNTLRPQPLKLPA